MLKQHKHYGYFILCIFAISFVASTTQVTLQYQVGETPVPDR